MGKTLTIHDLAESVEERLRQNAASHGRTPEAKARAILTREMLNREALDRPGEGNRPGDEVRRDSPAPPGGDIDFLIGVWEGRGTTGELMRETRGED